MSRNNKASLLLPFRDRNLNFPDRPCLIPDLRFYEMPDGLGIQVRGGESPCILRGEVAQKAITWLLQVLDGSLTIEEIFSRCPESITGEQLARALMVMFRRGLFASQSDSFAQCDNDKVMKKQLLFYGRRLGVTRAHLIPESVHSKIAPLRLALIGNGLFGTVTFDVLERSGFGNILAIDWSSDGFMRDNIAQVRQQSAGSNSSIDKIAVLSRNTDLLHETLDDVLPSVDFLVCATTTGSKKAFEIINRLCLRHSVTWLRGNDDGSCIEIGPLVIPYISACYQCLVLRRIASAEQAVEEELYEEELSRTGDLLAHQGESLPEASIAGGLLSAEVVRYAGKVALPSFENSVLRITTGGAFLRDSILRVPRCPQCYRGAIETSVESGPGLAGGVEHSAIG